MAQQFDVTKLTDENVLQEREYDSVEQGKGGGGFIPKTDNKIVLSF
jgi:hypothetical protein